MLKHVFKVICDSCGATSESENYDYLTKNSFTWRHQGDILHACKWCSGIMETNGYWKVDPNEPKHLMKRLNNRAR